MIFLLLFIYFYCRKYIFVIKTTLLKPGQAMSKASKHNNKSTNVSPNDSVRLANEGTLMNTMPSILDFCFELLCVVAQLWLCAPLP